MPCILSNMVMLAWVMVFGVLLPPSCSSVHHGIGRKTTDEGSDAQVRDASITCNAFEGGDGMCHWHVDDGDNELGDDMCGLDEPFVVCMPDQTEGQSMDGEVKNKVEGAGFPGAEQSTTSMSGMGEVRATTYVLRGDHIGPNDAPLINGQYISSSSPTLAHEFRSTMGLPRPPSSDVCLWPTDRGTVCVTQGNKPPEGDDLMPRWEGGGKKGKQHRNVGNKVGDMWRGALKRLKGRGSNRTTATDGTTADAVVTARASIKNGRMRVVTITTTRDGNGRTETREEVTFVSPRPKGWWKTPFAFFSKEGRLVKEASLRVSPNGDVGIKTSDGRTLWGMVESDVGGTETTSGSW